MACKKKAREFVADFRVHRPLYFVAGRMETLFKNGGSDAEFENVGRKLIAGGAAGSAPAEDLQRLNSVLFSQQRDFGARAN
jgi:hypothetical protein